MRIKTSIKKTLYKIRSGMKRHFKLEFIGGLIIVISSFFIKPYVEKMLDQTRPNIKIITIYSGNQPDYFDVDVEFYSNRLIQYGVKPVLLITQKGFKTFRIEEDSLIVVHTWVRGEFPCYYGKTGIGLIKSRIKLGGILYDKDETGIYRLNKSDTIKQEQLVSHCFLEKRLSPGTYTLEITGEFFGSINNPRIDIEYRVMVFKPP